jgi:hypothetical protein
LGTYDVHTKEYGSVEMHDDGTSWTIGVNVMAHARAQTGLATGSVAFE